MYPFISSFLSYTGYFLESAVRTNNKHSWCSWACCKEQLKWDLDILNEIPIILLCKGMTYPLLFKHWNKLTFFQQHFYCKEIHFISTGCMDVSHELSCEDSLDERLWGSYLLWKPSIPSFGVILHWNFKTSSQKSKWQFVSTGVKHMRIIWYTQKNKVRIHLQS